MKAVTIPEFGGPEVLRLVELADPVPGPGQVSVDVAYAGANFAEVLYRRGMADVPLPFVPGIEVSGRVRALGPGVRGLAVGQPVAALTIVDSGGYAGTVVTAAELVVPLDGGSPSGDGATSGLDLATAAAVPSNTTTAYVVLNKIARVEAGQSVLVHAAAGGVGSQLGQVARLLGAGRVVGTVGSPGKLEVAKAFGYDDVILREEVAERAPGLTGGRGFDVVVDPVGGPTRRQSLDVLAPTGRLVVMGNASGAADVAVSTIELWLTNRAVAGFNLAAFTAAYPTQAGAALRWALRVVAAGDVQVAVEELTLEEAAEAHRRIESGASTGKLVLRVGGA
ncbi:quinone oxidoreductase family protein [Allostreptomyces psammosilenae]|uniref:NADPH2:quinone reductase n=1 Tax=Allostreptomyces psammosilenae TaxID=1892865 RepID=A0A853A209_9ACTN|nr:zinc-binding dehydrogenase [Allostreptomyces psammosilenae]NYI06924.1 NADPH2:quinone reductase [Allostreptomyces psammosilenae]